MTDLPIRLVPQEELRRRFNAGMYWERALAGEFEQNVRRDGHPTADQSGEPFCTRSQIVAYIASDGTRTAVVHQYLQRDGTLGASGRPDPKLLVEDGTLLRPPRQD